MVARSAFCAPFSIEEIVKDHFDVPMIIAYMGAVWNVPEAIIVAERRENVYLETSATRCSARAPRTAWP
jgi:predicted TIM-barrel fold metal-dependent hydrolase